MALINTKETAEQFVRINFINSESSLPDFEAAEERYLIPVLGETLYEKVKQQAEALENGESTPEADEDLVRKCRAVVGPLAYLLELPFIQTQLTDAGLRTISTDTMQSAHRWEYNAVKEALADKGAYALDALLQYLFGHKGDYPEWMESEAYQEAASLIFTSGSYFNKYFPVHQPYRVFWALRPLIREVEDFHITPLIGEEFFNALKGTAALSPEEAKAVELIKKAVAQITIVKAIEKKPVKIGENGFTMPVATDPDGPQPGDQQARDPQLSLLHESCQRAGDAYLLQLKEWLNTNASETVFPIYFNSSHYEKPQAQACATSRNARRNSFGFL